MENEEENIETKKLTIEDFVVKRKIGEGSFGRTYYARDKKSNKKYVLKLSINKNDQTFSREIEMLKTLKNKSNIIKIINDFEDDKHYRLPEETDIDCAEGYVRYIVLEFIPKGNLFDYCKGNPFKEEYARVIFYKVLKGVQNIHNSGICHLDLKLENILMDKNYNPIICDFGLSGYIEDLKSGKTEKRSPGSLGYKAPELIKCKFPFDGIKADIFSLGAILFNLVTFKHIFCNYNNKLKDKWYKLIIEKKFDDYWEVVEINPSETFKNLFTKMVSYELSERPKNIEEILNSPWIKEYDDLSDDEKKDLEKEVIKDLEVRKASCDSECQTNQITLTSEKLDEVNKGQEEGNNYFTEDDLAIPELNLDDDIIMKNYIFIKGEIKPRFFMNKLANKIEQLFEEKNCSFLIEESKLYFKFNIIFKQEDNEEIPLEPNADLELLNEDYKGDLKIEIQLLKQDERYLISIFKKSGESEDFKEKFEQIIKRIMIV